MYLLHNTDNDKIITILQQGKLKPSSKTGNVRMFGQSQGSPYIFLRLNTKNDFSNFYIDHELLLENKFYLQTGWYAEPINNKIDGTKINSKKLKDLLNKFRIEVNKFIKSQKTNKIPMMSNEILVKKNIDLHKYLKKIIIDRNDKNLVSILEILKQKYPETKIVYYK